MSPHKENWQMGQRIASYRFFLLRCFDFQSWCFRSGLCETSPECQQTDIPLQRNASAGKLLGETLCYWEHPALFSAPQQPRAGVQWCVWARSNRTYSQLLVPGKPYWIMHGSMRKFNLTVIISWTSEELRHLIPLALCPRPGKQLSVFCIRGVFINSF